MNRIYNLKLSPVRNRVQFRVPEHINIADVPDTDVSKAIPFTLDQGQIGDCVFNACGMAAAHVDFVANGEPFVRPAVLAPYYQVRAAAGLVDQDSGASGFEYCENCKINGLGPAALDTGSLSEMPSVDYIVAAKKNELLAFQQIPVGEIIGANNSADALEKILGAAAANGLQPGAIKNRAPGRVRNVNLHHDARGRFSTADTGGGFGGTPLAPKGHSHELTVAEQSQSIDAALQASAQGKQASFSLGRVPDALASRVSKETNGARDWTGRELRIDSDFVTHARNYHPNLTDSDFHSIPALMSGADHISASTTNQKLAAVEFQKVTGGRRYLLVSASLNKAGQVQMTTLKKSAPGARAS